MRSIREIHYAILFIPIHQYIKCITEESLVECQLYSKDNWDHFANYTGAAPIH